MRYIIQIRKPDGSMHGIISSFLMLITTLLLFLCFTRIMASHTYEDQQNALSDAITRASIQCYAIEGRYPPSVEYLQEHYGIVINHDRFRVFYDGWASNIMPEITVLPRDAWDGKEGAD